VAAATLGGMKPMRSEVREVLQRMAERDSDPGVRHAAKLALGIITEGEVSGTA